MLPTKLNLILSLFFLSFISFPIQGDYLTVPQSRLSDPSEKGLIKLSVMYPYEEGKHFDMEYYKSKHMPMVANLLGSSLVKYTIEKGVASGIPNTQMPYMAIGSFYVKSLADYQAAIGPNRDAIRADFVNYTDINPIILVSEMIR
ncbi:EthD family reductase [Algoriphagus sp. Y33]|uniref:EthD family reductase n=1 Tax=Algoriphagus sp. Y33 TaxID=2772483 RepID=UPI0017827CB6|nr:EthD family reductase [Algoriphagus sp. Y33]